MNTALAEAQTNLAHAQKQMAIAMNRSCWSEEYNVGGKVVLSTKNTKSYYPHLPAKIKVQWVGPFVITHKVSAVASRVDFPPGWWLPPCCGSWRGSCNL